MDIKYIERLAKSAKLKFTPEDLQDWSVKMEKIFTWIDQLAQVETSGVPADIVSPVLDLREDAARAFENIPAIISAFPAEEEKMIRVKKVL
ncbi:MAG: aspartyl/glutamyl-tRNA amidotransferase subunit C [Elusimicrobium sp.]|jgi:aspartyl/glutamyl-tRNA(Asn/Gln) amidotransferase C subunit|nr:aspartyl/glutamyl-tRNA amidotransferase subunit C [Elusimicrobium sp.]